MGDQRGHPGADEADRHVSGGHPRDVIPASDAPNRIGRGIDGPSGIAERFNARALTVAAEA